MFVVDHNSRAWDALARQEIGLAQPATDAEFADPLAVVDPWRWLGGNIQGQRVLCLAAGGGRQSALYAAAGGLVTVVDASAEMLARDRAVAMERRLEIRAIQASMDDLSMLAGDEFDIVIQPVSTCYVADVQQVFRQVARVVRPGGIYISQHKSPTSLQAELKPAGRGYEIVEPYYRSGPLPATNPSRVRESGTLEFLHRWEELIGGMCRAGFVIADLVEPFHAQPDATRGTFAHRAKYIAPYVRIKAQRETRSGMPALLLSHSPVIDS
jgi:SAM-dependent methyltransferase